MTLDIGASLLSVSPKVAMDFSSPCRRSLNLDNGDLRAWAEMGRKVALNSAEEAGDFFRFSNEVLAALPESLRLIDRALLETDRAFAHCGPGHLPQRAAHGRIARRRAFRLASVQNRGRSRAPLGQTQHRSFNRRASGPQSIAKFRFRRRELDSHGILVARSPARPPLDAVLDLAENPRPAHRRDGGGVPFSGRRGAGFIQSQSDVVELCKQTANFLERGGATALQYFRSARSVIEIGGASSFEKWNRVTRKVADEGNAIVYDFLKLTPKVLATIRVTQRKRAPERVNAVLDVVEELAGQNVYVALECFKQSASAGRGLARSVSGLGREGASLHREDRRKAQAYYALESKTSQDSLRGAHDGVALESIAHLLRLYVEGLTDAKW